MALKILKKIIAPTGQHLASIENIIRNGKPLKEARKGILEKFLLAVHHLTVRCVSHRPAEEKHVSYDNQYINISSNEWKGVLGSSSYLEIIQLLIENGVIERFGAKQGSYSSSKENKHGKPFSKAYRLHSSWRNAAFDIITIEYTEPQTPRKATRASKRRSRRLNENNTDLLSKQDKTTFTSILERFTLDKQKAKLLLPIIAKDREWSIRTKVAMLWMIEEFENIKHFTIAKTGRLCCIGNRIATELRAAILLDGKPTRELDIACSNPTILYSLYPESSLERQKYRILVESGRLYDEIADDLRMMRNTAKQGTYKVMFGGKDKKISAWFAHRFPELSAIMAQYPKGELSRILQRKEAEVIVKGLMLDSGITCLSIHDGLRVAIADKEKAEAKIIDLFEVKFGITPKITTDFDDNEMDCAA